jgi:hypothetical protein
MRIFLDLDPGFNQLWHATQGIDMNLSAHTDFVTIGKRIGSDGCAIPTCGVQWLGTLQPLVLDICSPAPLLHDAFTSIGNWRGYGSIEHGGVFYGQKAHSLRAFIDLPRKSRENFLLAFAIDPGETRDLEALRRHGWKLVEPCQVATTPQQYLEFVSSSKAEFGIAKSGYVASRCGWFSDRSICYLGSGRPVIAQDTAFSDFLPVGAGLFRFNSTDDILHAMDEINHHYDVHSKAARALAEDQFDSDKVLSALLHSLGLSS